MMMVKGLFLAGFMLASVFAGATSEIKPAMATLEVQSNFDFSLTRKEFRVHYSGLGEGFTAEGNPSIKIYKRNSPEETHSFDISEANKNVKKIYQFAVAKADDGEYEVAVCVGETCSERNPALTEIIPLAMKKITCKRVVLKDNNLVDSTNQPWEETFFGPSDDDWIPIGDFDKIKKKINGALRQAGKSEDYQTDFEKLSLTENPQYKSKTFYAGLYYDIKVFKKLFDKMPARGTEGTEYADEFCERKYLLSAHAHIVDQSTKEVKHRFKTTLFLSEGGKRMYVLDPQAEKVHVEMTHDAKDINTGTYDLWIIFCATEKDAIESTFCADPIIKSNFEVSNE